MKKLAYILLMLLVLAACTDTSRNPQLVAVDSLLLSRPDSALTLLRSMSFSSTSDRMYYYLLLADACNKCYDTLPSDSILQEVAEYYDRHGNPNEQVRAHYLLGCAYRDLGEAPHALDCYHTAVSRADTTANDCDFRTLSLIHSQTAALLGEQMLPRQQLEELNLQYANAIHAKDTLCALNALGQMANVYNMLDMPDSSIFISNKLSDIYCSHGLIKKMALTKGGIILSCINKNNFEEAKKCIDTYKLYAVVYDKEGRIENGREAFYGIEGRYYIGVQQYDSAEYFFRKELESTIDLNNHEYAYRGLYMVFKQTGQRDSMSKYAELAYNATDAHFKEKQSDELRHMHALYNYSRHQSIARQKTAEANRNRQTILIGSFISVIIITILLFGIYLYRHKKQEEIRLLQRQYENDVDKLEQAKYDLMKMKEAQFVHLMAEKESDLEILKRRLERYGQSISLKKQENLEDFLLETDIYRRLRYLVMHPKEKITNDEWKELRETIEKAIPNFYETIHRAMANIKPSDYDICLLDRLYFSPSEIAILTGYGLSTITMKRVRLLEKLFQISGKGEQFDILIRNIK